MSSKLFLIPVTLGSDDFQKVIPDKVLAIINDLRRFVVEDIRSARRFLRLINPDFPIDDSSFIILNKHTNGKELKEIIIELKNDKRDTGMMSEAGLPAIADPGAELIARAHKNDIPVIPLSGPSSIFLALMASGMNGQEFAFNGYLPVKRPERIKSIKHIEKKCRGGQTQIFMETPYRNISLAEDLLSTLSPEINLCIASNITLQGEYIHTYSVSDWKKKGLPDINKKPAIFIIGV